MAYNIVAVSDMVNLIRLWYPLMHRNLLYGFQGVSGLLELLEEIL